MEKRVIGSSGIEVHPIGIGLWAMGNKSWGPTDDTESLQTIDRALELGVDFFDTADVYGDGHSELLLGKAMKGRRSRFIVGTKIGWVGFNGEEGVSAYSDPENVIRSVHENLKRLQTDYIDLLQWHVNFQEPGMEGFIEGCERMKKKGTIRAYGVSTSDFPYIQEFSQTGSPDSLQIDYSILNRTPEKEIFPYCRKQNIGTIIRGGLAMGLLSGKMNRDSSFQEGDFRNNWLKDPEQNRQFIEDLETVNSLRRYFPGSNLAQLAIRFVLSNPDVSLAIPGAKRISQLESNLSSIEKGVLSEEEMEKINRIVPPGLGRKIWPA